MKISQLEYVIKVQETGSINLAATQLYISQSRISNAIKELENELGDTIFMRSNKGISLTPFGKEFIPYARSVVVQIDQMKRLNKGSTRSIESVTICNNNFKFTSDLASILFNRHKESGLHMHIKECSRQEGIDMVSNHVAEIAVQRIWSFQSNVMSQQLNSKNIRFFPLTIVPTAVVVGKNNPLFYSESNYIKTSALEPYAPIIFDYAQYNPNVTINEKLKNLHSKNRITVSTSIAAAAVLENTDGYLVTAALSDPELNLINDYPNCRILELSDCNHYGQIGWIKHKQTQLSPLAQEFVDLLTDYLQSKNMT